MRILLPSWEKGEKAEVDMQPQHFNVHLSRLAQKNLKKAAAGPRCRGTLEVLWPSMAVMKELDGALSDKRTNNLEYIPAANPRGSGHLRWDAVSRHSRESA